MGAGNADGVFGEDGGDFGDGAGAVGDVEADVVSSGGFRDGDEISYFPIRQETAVVGGVGEVAGGLDEVGYDGGGGGALAGTASVEKGFAGGVGVDRDGVKNSVDGGENVFLRDEGGLDAELHGAALVLADDGEELDDVSKGFREFDVGGADLLDAGDVDIFRVDGETVGEGGKKNGLVSGVPAVDVEGGIGLRIAERLGFAEGGGVVDAAQGHLLEDVVRGAVNDTGEGVDAIADEGILNNFYDGDAARDGGLEEDRGLHFP